MPITSKYGRTPPTNMHGGVGRQQEQHHMEEACSKACSMTALWVAMIVSFCLAHPVAVAALIICRGVCLCTEML